MGVDECLDNIQVRVGETMQSFAKTTTFPWPRTIKESSSFLIKLLMIFSLFVCLLVCRKTSMGVNECLDNGANA